MLECLATTANKFQIMEDKENISMLPVQWFEIFADVTDHPSYRRGGSYTGPFKKSMRLYINIYRYENRQMFVNEVQENSYFKETLYDSHFEI